MKIALASDHAGYNAKLAIKADLEGEGYEVREVGTDSADSCEYPDFALAAATAVARGEFERGVLICSTGVGISIAANKVRGIRCALCADEICAEYSRRHNDAQIIAMGAKVTSLETMKTLVNIFLTTDFEGGRHQRRVDKIMAIEQLTIPN